MGEPIRIVDLAREMIHRSGLRIGEDNQHRIHRRSAPAKKLHEELAAIRANGPPRASKDSCLAIAGRGFKKGGGGIATARPR